MCDLLNELKAELENIMIQEGLTQEQINAKLQNAVNLINNAITEFCS